MSSKSRAANFFIADTLLENRRIVPRPNVGTCRNLIHMLTRLGICIRFQTHLLLNSATAEPSRAIEYKIRMMWMKVAFQTPSSNSCSRSTTSMAYGLKPKEPSFSTKAFYIKCQYTHHMKYGVIRTTVGTSEKGLSSRSIGADMT